MQEFFEQNVKYCSKQSIITHKEINPYMKKKLESYLEIGVKRFGKSATRMITFEL
jgi:hypothetical protein